MKTIAIVAISVGVSVAVVLGVLFGIGAYEQLEYEKALAEYNEFYSDYLIASSYQDEIDNVDILWCPPRLVVYPTVAENIKQAEEAKKRLSDYIDFILLGADPREQLREKINEIQEKYSGTKYYQEFNFQSPCEGFNKSVEELLKDYYENKARLGIP